MAEQQLVKLGPWPDGINNIEQENSDVYKRVDGTGLAKTTLASLREAINVDLDNDGWVSRRDGYTKVYSATNAHSGYSFNGRLYFVDDGDLLSLEPNGNTVTTIATDVGTAEIMYEEFGGELFWISVVKVGKITKNNTSTYWGLNIFDSPTVSYSSTGNLLPGEYIVYCTYETSDGLESGTRLGSKIILEETGGILVSWNNTEPNAAYVNIYVTPWNAKEALWQGKMDVDLGSAIVTSVDESADTLVYFNMYPPPSGGNIVSRHAGYLLIAKDNILYVSQPNDPHKFKQTDIQIFEDRIVAVESVDTGLYVATANRKIYWIEGAEPQSWKRTIKGHYLVTEGRALRQRASDLGISIDFDQVVPIMFSEVGPIVGLPFGNLKYPKERSMSFDAYTKVASTYRNTDGREQLLFNLRTKDTSAGFGASDKAVVGIIRNAVFDEPQRLYLGDTATVTVT